MFLIYYRGRDTPLTKRHFIIDFGFMSVRYATKNAKSRKKRNHLGDTSYLKIFSPNTLIFAILDSKAITRIVSHSDCILLVEWIRVCFDGYCNTCEVYDVRKNVEEKIKAAKKAYNAHTSHRSILQKNWRPYFCSNGHYLTIIPKLWSRLNEQPRLFNQATISTLTDPRKKSCHSHLFFFFGYPNERAMTRKRYSVRSNIRFGKKLRYAYPRKTEVIMRYLVRPQVTRKSRTNEPKKTPSTRFS